MPGLRAWRRCGHRFNYHESLERHQACCPASVTFLVVQLALPRYICRYLSAFAFKHWARRCQLSQAREVKSSEERLKALSPQPHILVLCSSFQVLVKSGSYSVRPFPSIMAYALHDAARKGDLAELTAIIGQGANLDQRDKHHRTPLHLAAWAGALDDRWLGLPSKGRRQ
jgi:ankyrin repeat protein